MSFVEMLNALIYRGAELSRTLEQTVQNIKDIS